MALPARFGLVGAGLVGALLVGAAVGVLASPAVIPGTLRDAPVVDAVPVVSSEFSDPQVVEVRVSAESDIAITAVTGGRVTELACDPNSPMSSGSFNVAIDGVRLVNLATRVPLWRDLKVGDRGDDVTALQEELARLGQALTVNGRVTRETVAAANTILQAIGSPPFAGGLISTSRLVWLPSASTSVYECRTTVGEHLAGGTAIASAHAPGHASVVLMPTRMVGGERVLVVDGVEIPVDESGTVEDEVSIDALRRTPSYRTALDSAASGPISVAGSLRLAAPTIVSGVPPSSVVTDGDLSCIFSGRDAPKAYAITVVGSLLGQSLITFEDATPPTFVMIDPEQTTCE